MYITGITLKKLKMQQAHKEIYLAMMILREEQLVNMSSKVPSSIFGLIKLLDNPIKARGMLTTQKIRPKNCMFS